MRIRFRIWIPNTAVNIDSWIPWIESVRIRTFLSSWTPHGLGGILINMYLTWIRNILIIMSFPNDLRNPEGNEQFNLHGHREGREH
jgi:hypothetical protein